MTKFWSRLSSCFMSVASSSKLYTSKFIFWCSAFADFGSGMKPCCRLHLISTCALLTPCFSATLLILLCFSMALLALPNGE